MSHAAKWFCHTELLRKTSLLVPLNRFKCNFDSDCDTSTMANKNPASSPQKPQNLINKRFRASSPQEDVALLIKQTVESERITTPGGELNADRDFKQSTKSPLSACVSKNGALLRSLQDNINSQAAKVETLSTKLDTLQESVREDTTALPS